jgi:AcrR family transcriptional regulator
MPRRARTAPRRKPLQKRAEDTIVVLLDATERVVAKRGFHAATTNHIARIAGVSIGTLYHYFPTKEALVAAVVERMWRMELASVMKHAGAFATAPLPEAIRLATRALTDCVAARIDLYRAWYVEASHLGELAQGLAMTDEAIGFIRSVLDARAAEVRPTDHAFAADLAVKTALAVVRTGARDWEEQVKSGVLADHLADMLTRYLVSDLRSQISDLSREPTSP